MKILKSEVYFAIDESADCNLIMKRIKDINLDFARKNDLIILDGQAELRGKKEKSNGKKYD